MGEKPSPLGEDIQEACARMENYRKATHSIYDLKFHLVWVTKYRKPVLTGDVACRLRDLVRRTCRSLDVEIVKGRVSKARVRLLVSVPPTRSVSKLMQRLKGRTARMLLDEYRAWKRQFWGCHHWARGHFAVSTGNVTEEMVKRYIEEQDQPERAQDDVFRIEGESPPQSTSS
jgi:putative transposase